jgi:Glycosyltransferase family 87
MDARLKTPNPGLGQEWTLPAVLLLSAIGILHHARGLSAPLRHQQYLDFGRFYFAARQWISGGSLYDASPATWLQYSATDGLHLWNLNPPWSIVPFLALARLPIHWAFGLWTVLTVTCLVVSTHLVIKETRATLSRPWTAVVLAFVMVATPTLAAVNTGQITGPLLLLIIWIWRSWRHDRWVSATIGIGILVAMKVVFAPLFFYLLFRRQYRALVVGVFTVLGIATISVAVWGLHEHQRWLHSLDEATRWLWLSANTSLVAPVARAMFVGDGKIAYSESMHSAWYVALILIIPIALVGLLAATRTEHRDRALALYLLTILLVSPLGWIYYWWLFVPPVAALHGDRAVRLAALMSLPAWVVPVMWYQWPERSPFLAATAGSLGTWALLALWSGVLASSMACQARRTAGIPITPLWR